MPRLNLKEDPFEGDITQDTSDRSVSSPPSLRDVGGGGGVSPLLLIIIILVVLAGGVFLLNHFGVIHLWGEKTTQLAEDLGDSGLPPPDWAAEEGESQTEAQDPLLAPTTELPPPGTTPDVRPPAGAQQQADLAPPQATSKPKPAPPPPSIASSGTGEYTIQISAWMSQQKADAEAAKLNAAGYSAFVEDASVGGDVWYRVRVGRYGSMGEAQQAAAQLQPMMESQLWVSRVGR